MTQFSCKPATAAITAATAATLAIVLLRRRRSMSSFYQSHRGINGILRYIWIGDHLPPPIRVAMDELDAVEEQMTMAEVQLETIEILIERTLLESVDGPTVASTGLSDEDRNIGDPSNTDRIDLQKQLFQQHPELKKDIALFSNLLDKLAASIDAINSQSDDEVKRRKKGLSTKIVYLMNELDRMMASLNLQMR
mmetsp:Transcript_22176/g.44404  ORF Transcript_22176/g.44404 Transcript_22176/m.44404 type:complete len:194 (-) Transcript_22176:307-888(-)